MKKILPILLIPALLLFLCVGNAMAINISELGTNITINDGIPNNTGGGIGAEDDEVETISIQNQVWDQEGVFWDGTILSFVGGFNYKNGVAGWDTGDIFIGNYALDLDRDGSSESLKTGGEFKIYENYTDTYDPKQGHSPESAPWLYRSGGSFEGSGKYEIIDDVIDDEDFFNEWGSNNNNRWALQLWGETLASIIDSGALIHLTLECGNDTIHARVPEPATILLLGTGLIGLAGIGRKRFIK